MDTVEIKEEHIIDVSHTLHSHDDEYPLEPYVELLNSSPPVDCHFFFSENADGMENCEGGGESELDPLAAITETANYPFVHDEQIALDKLAKTSASFYIIDPLTIMNSENTTIKIEPTRSEDAIDLKPASSENAIDFSNVEVLSRKNVIDLSDIDVINTFSIKADPDTSKTKTYANEKAVLAVAQPQERVGQRKLKRKASNTSTQQKIPKCNLEIVNKFGLKTLTVNIGPKLPIPQCYLHSLKLKIYSCNKCNSKFTDSTAFDAHLVSCGNSLVKTDRFKHPSSLYHCGICIYKFKEMINLQNHMMKHHCKNFSCNICLKEFSTVDELHVHNDQIHKAKSLNKIYACNVCNHSTPNHSHLKEHLIRHITDKCLYCYRCRRNCEDEADYSKHWAKLHGNVESRKRRRINSGRDRVPDKMRKKGSVRDGDDIIYQNAYIRHEEQTVNDTMLPIENNKMVEIRSSYESEIVIKKGIYSCSTCVYKFSKLENLKAHMKQHLDTERPFKCRECKYESFSVLNMNKHSKRMCHNLICECNVCDFKSKEWRVMKRHAINHVYDGLFCRKCSLNFENYELCREHMFVEHNVAAMENLFSCDQCSYTHPIESSYQHHFKISHNRKFAKRNICKRLVKTKLGQNEEGVKIVGHSEKITIGSNSTRLIKSEKCHLDKNVNSRRTCRDSTSHKPLHYQYKCAKCDFTTNKFESFITHDAQKHTSVDKPFQCNICYKKLSLLKLYLKHMSLHDGISVYECPYCMKYSSISEVEFNKHAMNHEIYTCPMCVYKTCNVRLFKNHIVKQHKPGKGAFVCPLCPYSVNEQKKLSLHCLRFHPKNFLSMRLPIPASLRAHDEHNGSIGCKLCPFTCRKTYGHDLKRHVIKHFTNGSLSKLKSEKLGFKRSQKSTFGLKKHSKINKTRIHNPDNKYSMCYRCSKCNKKSNDRCTISTHLRIHHKIIGGVRDNMILKVQIRLPDSSDQKSAVSTDSDVPVEHTPVNHNGSESSNTSKSESDDSNVPIDDTLNKVAPTSNNKSSNKYLYYCCSKCNMMSRLRTSVQNHLRLVHRIFGGGVKNEMIYKIGGNSKSAKKEANRLEDSSVTQQPKIDFSLEVTPNANENDITNQSIFYRCSKCEYKGNTRHLVYNHLRRRHNITGGVRNNKILKVCGRADVIKQENETVHDSNRTTLNQIMVTSTKFKESTSLSKLDLFNPVQNKSIKITKTSPNHDIYYYCSHCNFKTKHKKALKSHLRRHKIVGALRNKKVSKVLNDQPRFDTNERTTCSSSSNSNMRRLNTRNDFVLQAINKEEQSTEYGFNKTKQTPPSMSFDSGSTYFFCLICNYKNKLRRTLYNHLAIFHNVEKKRRPNFIHQGNMDSKHNEIETNKIDEQCEAENQLETQIPNNKASSSLYCSATSSTRAPVPTNDSASFDDEIKPGKNKCHLCNIHNMSEFAQMDHKRIGHKRFWGKPFFCKVDNCGVRFTAMSSLSRHESKHSMNSFLCTICKKFKTYRADVLQSHQYRCSMKITSTPMEDQNEVNNTIENTLMNPDTADMSDEDHFSCGECDYVTMDVTLFMKHMDIHIVR